MSAPAEFVADLHIHSRYAYACSKNLTLANLSRMARVKGIDLLATGDFTHPEWLAELETNLCEVDWGTFEHSGVNFVLGTEVSCVFKQGGRTRRVHILVFLSSLQAVKQFNGRLSQRGTKLDGDGRPTLKMSAADLAGLSLELDSEAIVIPAHIWTPWFGVLGSVSGFDSLDECFGNMAPALHAVETGLSSDPAMNWVIPELADRAIVSFSDAHSLPNLGREATVFQGSPNFADLRKAIRQNSINRTIEFYPEEGKYHYDGHRKCGIRQSPAETMGNTGGICSICGRPLTLGVLHRVLSLSARHSSRDSSMEISVQGLDADGHVRSPDGRPPYIRLVPLEELLAWALNVGRRTKTVADAYRRLCREFGSELEVLMWAGEDELRGVAGVAAAAAIVKARRGEVAVDPGFDGQYGSMQINAL